MAQWFWIVFVMVVAIMFACRCIDLNDPQEPLTNDQAVETPATGNGSGTSQGSSFNITNSNSNLETAPAK